MRADRAAAGGTSASLDARALRPDDRDHDREEQGRQDAADLADREGRIERADHYEPTYSKGDRSGDLFELISGAPGEAGTQGADDEHDSQDTENAAYLEDREEKKSGDAKQDDYASDELEYELGERSVPSEERRTAECQHAVRRGFTRARGLRLIDPHHRSLFDATPACPSHPVRRAWEYHENTEKRPRAAQTAGGMAPGGKS